MKRIYKREAYLRQLRPFYDSDLIKVITGIRRCGKSCLLRTVMDELRERGIPDKDISGLNIPTATPYVFEFDDDLNLVNDYYLGDAAAIAAKAAAVANQGKA